MQDQPLKGIGYYSLAVFMFSIVGACAHYLNDKMGFVDIVFVRSFIVTLIMFAVIAWKNQFYILKTKRIKSHFLRGIVGLISLCMITLSYMMMPISETTILLFTNPFFVALLSVPLIGEKVSKAAWISIAIGFIGIVIAVGPEFRTLKWGVLVALSSSVATACVSLLLRDMGKTEPSETIVFYFALFCTLAMMLVYLFVPCEINWHEIPILLLIGGAAYIAQISLTRGHLYSPSAQLMPFQYVGILWAALIDFFFLHIVPGWSLILGGMIVIGCGLYMFYEAS